MQIDPDAPTALIWLPDGETPSHDDFHSVEQRWTLEAAVAHAYETMKEHDKAPWIKVGDDVLGSDGIEQVRSGLRAMGMFR